jgi:hypothetical protein
MTTGPGFGFRFGEGGGEGLAFPLGLADELGTPAAEVDGEPAERDSAVTAQPVVITHARTTSRHMASSSGTSTRAGPAEW